MKSKKFNFIIASLIFMIYLFGIFSNTNALNYKFGTNCDTQILSNGEKLTINLNLVDGYYEYIRLHPFACEIRFNKNLFNLSKIIPMGNIAARDIHTENTDDALTVRFNPSSPKLVNFSNHFAEILKINLLCKSADNLLQSYVSVKIIDSETNEPILNKFTEITIKNVVPNKPNEKGQHIDKTNNNTNAKNLTNKAPADCHLKSIIPSFGNLNPSFNPNTLKYKMEVPKEIQEIYFDVTPISDNTDVKISKHRLNSPGTITYINITNKNGSKSLSYLIEVKRNIVSSTATASKPAKETRSKSNSHGKRISKSGNKYTKSGKSKSKNAKRKKKKGCGKDSNSENTDCEDEDDEESFDDEEIPENKENTGKTQSKSSNLKNNKTYWIVAFVALCLSTLIYLYFKKKSQSSKNSEDISESNVNNLIEK